MLKNILLIFILATAAFGQTHYTTVWEGRSPYQAMNIYLSEATFNGSDLVDGDEIGVFDGDLCVGSVLLDGPAPEYLEIKASKDDPQTTEVDGYTDGHMIIYKLWDSSEGREVTEVSVTYDPTSTSTVFNALSTAFVDLDFQYIPNTLLAPSDLDGYFSNGSIQLTWKDNSNNELGFVIERATNYSNNFNIIDSVEADIVVYHDTLINQFTIYIYRIRAYNEYFSSEYSDTINVQTSIDTVAAPSNLIAQINDKTIELNWEDNSDNETGFLIDRKVNNNEFVFLTIVNANINNYRDSIGIFHDSTYSYRLKAFNEYDTSAAIISEPIVVSVELVGFVPKNFEVNQNYPNPFNPSTKIQYSIPSGEQVKVVLKVYDLLGNEVKTLVDEYKSAGNYEVEFNASKLSSGAYFYKLSASGGAWNYIQTKKMLLVK